MPDPTPGSGATAAPGIASSLRRRALVGFAGAVLLAATGCGATTGDSPASSGAAARPTGTAYGWHGAEPDRVVKRPQFTLRDTAGKAFDFYAETAGQPTLMYFGYTNCPDECPTAMADITAALRRTPADLRRQVKVVLVTTDPARDTPAVLRTWLDTFSTQYIGLVGTTAEVDAAQRAAGVQPAVKEGPVPTLPGKPNEHTHKPGTAPHTHTGPLGYGVGHTNVIFAYSAQDTLPVAYPGGITPSDIAADLPELARD